MEEDQAQGTTQALPDQMAPEDHYDLRPIDDEEQLLAQDVIALVRRVRKFDPESILLERWKDDGRHPGTFVQVLRDVCDALLVHGLSREADAIRTAVEKCLEHKSHGGFGFSGNEPFTPEMRQRVSFQVEAWLESLNSEDNAHQMLQPLDTRPSERRPMTLSQKILAHHAVGNVPREGLAQGDFVRTSVDWVISSELAWGVAFLPTTESSEEGQND